ncbi:MAG: phosphatase PAP2 family protein [Ilumatobacteraceae bacterium]
MPIFVALVIAVAISALVFAVAASRGRGGDAADVRAEPADVPAKVVAEHPWLKRFFLARFDASTETGLLLTIAVGAVAVAIVVIGVLLEMVNGNSGFAKLDDAAARFGVRHTTDNTTRVLKFLTELGATTFVVVLFVIVGIGQYWRHRLKAIPLFMATALVSTIVVNNLVKMIVDRERPDIARLVGAYGSSFPSGHSATAAAAYASLALVFGRSAGRRARAALAGAAAAITFAVASSRVLLGVHWLTDVIAGVLLGWSCFALCSIAFGGRILRFGQPVEVAKAVAKSTDSQAHDHAAQQRSAP